MHEPYEYLAARDAVLSELIELHGMPDPFAWADVGGVAVDEPTSALLLHICGQQISTSVALAVHRRLLTLVDDRPTPEALVALTPDQLVSVGLSRAKVRSVRDLARQLVEGRLALTGLQDSTDDRVMQALCAVRGIGPWTAQMYLLHQLRRPDVLPAADIGLRRACAHAYRLPSLPDARDVVRLAAPWQPYRSYAVALLWADLRQRRSTGGAMPDG